MIKRIVFAIACGVVAFAVTAPAFAATVIPVTSDKESYVVGDSALVTATYKGGRSLRLTVTRPNGTVAVSTTVRAATRTSTAYRYRFTVTSSGTWTATFTDPKIASGTLKLSVTPVVTPPPPPPPPPSAGGPHDNLTWAEYPTNCRGCHADEFSEMYGSLHYQWQASAPDNTNQTGTLQGKATNAINSYCINPAGNWGTCGKCHAGRGAEPVMTSNPTAAQLDNIDCLVCHNDKYAVARVRRPDGSMGPTSTDIGILNGYVRSISKPTKTACLKCHAFAGGGDSYKRGDITWAHKSTTDRNFDVHMATTGANLSCQSCHTFVGHKVTGKGSDLQATDYAAEIQCTKCHAEMATSSGHGEIIGKHVARVACQTCHIPRYARNAADTAATEATEINRDWRTPASATLPTHPSITTANDLVPAYRWWNRKSDTYLLGDTAKYDAATGAYATSRPIGSVSGAQGNKIYPFKYKTATQPMRTFGSVLIALDTNEYMNRSGDPVLATTKGLFNMGFSMTDAWTWVKTDTYQLLNHEVPPASGNALTCNSCHGSTARMDLKGKLGYGLKGPRSTVCVQCHEAEDDALSFTSMHDKHVKDKGYDCSFCHSFSRPERGLRTTR